MKTKIILAASLLLIGTSCKKNCMDSQVLPDGNYAGTFRVTQLGEGTSPVISHVTLRLHGGQFEGDSDSMYHPMICHGTFTRTDNTVSFKTLCNLPAIPNIVTLDNTWDISTEGDSVSLKIQNFIEEKYLLTLKRTD